MERVVCPQCDVRPTRRACPALGREICAQCCGESREETLACPLECEFLREARWHEKIPEPDPSAVPFPEIELTDTYMKAQQPLATVVGRLLLASAMQTEHTVDADVEEALDSLIRTYKTAESGLIYESRPSNAIAAAVVVIFEQDIAKFRAHIAEQSGSHTVRDKDLLGVLVFWRRVAWRQHNGRRRGRAFTERLFALMPPPGEPEIE
jgi:hypothetical protein